MTSDVEPNPFEAPSKRARLTWASTIKPERVLWGWEDVDGGRIPAGALCVAAGREGTGKSSFGIWMAAQLTRGELPGSFFGQPRTVFYVAVEDSWKHTLVPRLIAAGADLDRIARFDVVNEIGDELTLSLPADLGILEAEILQHNAALVVVDPLMSVINSRIDTHRERDTRSALDPLARTADKTGAIVLGIAHFNKGAGTDAASLITGSGAFKNVPRAVFGFARDETSDDGTRVLSQVKNSLGRDDLPSLAYRIEEAEIATDSGPAYTARLLFTGPSEKTVADVLRAASRFGDDEEDDRREVDSWLVSRLEDEGGAANARDVLSDGRDSGFTDNEIKKARRRVNAKSERIGFGKGSRVVWSLGAAIDATGAKESKPEPMAPMGTNDEPEQHHLNLDGDAA